MRSYQCLIANRWVIFFLLFLIGCLFATEVFGVDTIRHAKEKTISLNFQDIKIRAALQILAEFSGFNLVVDDKVQGSVSLHLDSLPWEQALDIILKTQGLIKRPIKNGWLIATQDEFFQQDKKEQEIQRQQHDLDPLLSQLIEVRYADATALAVLLKDQKNAFLSSGGSISVDKRTNSLWIQASKEKLIKIKKAIRKLDRPIEQVAIEARIVSLDKSKEKELGVRLGLVQSPSAPLPKPSDASESRTALLPLNMDLPLSVGSAVAGGALGVHVLRLGKNVLLDLELSALEDEGRARVISAPHLITEDQKEATIAAGEAIPYQEKNTTGDSSIVFKEAVLSLTVTPRILPDRRLALVLGVQQDQPSKLMVYGAPAIQKRGIKTQVIVKNGETVILGGIYEDSQNQRVERIPFLGSLPLIGNLFSYKETSYKHSELLIFVTPSIIDS